MTDVDTLKAVSKIEDPNALVSIMVLCSQMLDMDTVSEMARKGKKEGGVSTPRGIIKSNKYIKKYIGKQQFAIKGEGILDDSEFPW